VVRPERFELPAFWFVATSHKLWVFVFNCLGLDETGYFVLIWSQLDVFTRESTRGKIVRGRFVYRQARPFLHLNTTEPQRRHLPPTHQEDGACF